ncbi:MAG: DUF4347 domain-containing protein, partial [Gammaproteobacteria bacterium]|nr:DUF4347 domain-containing protein [Gammaproteobacteria bacterium]
MFINTGNKHQKTTTQDVSVECHPVHPPLLLTAIALEPRIMFDGAALVDAIDPQIAEPLVIETPAPAPEVAEGGIKTNAIVFVDSAVNDYQTLIDGISAETEVIILDAGRDGLQQMTEALSGRSGIDAIHIISHGQAGVLKLGDSSIDQAALEGYSSELASIGSALAADGDILLYGCDIAEGGGGDDFIQQLSSLTGADVAASDDTTGAMSLGGDGDLEVFAGDIHTSSILTEETLQHYSSTLVTNTLDFSSDTTSGFVTATHATANFGTINFKIVQDANSTGTPNASLTLDSEGSLDDTQAELYFFASTVAKYLVIYTDGREVDFQSIKFGSSIGTTIYTSLTGYAYKDGALLGDQIISSAFPNDTTSTLAVTFTDSEFENADEIRLIGVNNFGTEINDFLFDDLVIGDPVAANAAPTVIGTPSDPALTEDTEGNIDLSALTFADADGDNLTVTLTASEGTFSTPVDGSGVGSGVTETWVDATHVTLAGSATDINTYLDTASNIKYTGASNDNGDNTSTVTVSATDGNGGNLVSDPVVNVDIAAVPDITISAIDISADTGTSAADFETKTASQTITATLSAGITGSEVLNGSVDGGSTWANISSKVSGTSVSWDGATLSGSSSIQLKVTDTGNDGPVATQAYTLDTTAPTTTIGSIDISADTGTDGDFVTKTASQTITGTLSSGLAAGEILQGSVDGGSTWADVSGKVTGTAISWDGATLSGASSIKLKVTDAAGNDAPVATQAYTLDTTAPTTTIGSIDISADTGTDGDFETKTASQTITGTLSAGLAAGEVLQGSVDGGSTWVDVSGKVTGTAISWDGATLSGTSSIKFKVTDSADNDGTTATQAYTLDTTAPTTTISGIDISADTGTSDADFETKTASQTISGTLSTGLAAGEILQGSVDGGSTWVDVSGKVTGTSISWDGATLSGISSIKFKVTDAADNDGAVATQAYTLDTTAPTTTISGIDISADTGSSSTDFETKTALQTIT